MGRGMERDEFLLFMQEISNVIRDRPLDAGLESLLNARFPAESPQFTRLVELCECGEAEGWLMGREMGGIRFGRAVKPGNQTGRFSVDVVRMKNTAGPHHIHTTGEIGAIMPISGTPEFDGKPKGWYVYHPGSDHHPTVTGGEAYILYLLPGGEIEFTGK